MQSLACRFSTGARWLVGADSERCTTVGAKWIVFTGILVGALLLRVWAIGYDLPYIYHADEPVYIGISQTIFKTRDLNPHFFNYPSLFFYANSLAYLPYYAAGKLLGVFNSPQDVLAPVSLAMGVTQLPMPTVALLGRGLTLLFGLGSITLVWLIGERLTGKVTVGALAALMMAVSPIHAAHDRFVMPETYVAFFVLGTFLFSVSILKHGHTSHYVAAGVCAGLAASSKYNGAMILVALVAAHFMRTGKQGLRDPRVYMGVMLSGVAFLATTPYALLDHEAFRQGLLLEIQHYSTGHPGWEGNAFGWYLSFLWQTMGPISILAVLAMGYGVVARSKEFVLLSAFAAIYLPFIGRMVVRTDRMVVPLVPFLCLLAATLLVALHARIQASMERRPLFVALAGLTILALTWPTITMLKDTLWLTGHQSREQARRWLDDHVPSGSKLAIESYSPFVDPGRFTVEGVVRMIDHPIEWYVDNQFDYLVFSDAMFGRYFADAERYADQVRQYNLFFHAFEEPVSFDDGRIAVHIYKVRGD